jgi:hypothetical protein
MKRKRLTEVQIISVLKEHEAGLKTGDLPRKRGTVRLKTRVSVVQFRPWAPFISKSVQLGMPGSKAVSPREVHTGWSTQDFAHAR